MVISQYDFCWKNGRKYPFKSLYRGGFCGTETDTKDSERIPYIVLSELLFYSVSVRDVLQADEMMKSMLVAKRDEGLAERRVVAK